MLILLMISVCSFTPMNFIILGPITALLKMIYGRFTETPARLLKLKHYIMFKLFSLNWFETAVSTISLICFHLNYLMYNSTFP